MHPAGKAVGRFGVQALGKDRAAGADEIPGSSFQKHVGGGLGHFGFQPAHHPGQR